MSALEDVSVYEVLPDLDDLPKFNDHFLPLPSAFDHLSAKEALQLLYAEWQIRQAWDSAREVIGDLPATEFLRDRLIEFLRDAGGRPRRKRCNLGLGLRTRVLKRGNFMCASCGSERDLVIDHLVPVARGGSDGEWNLQVLCDPCNTKKSDGPA